jgi:hypothetical protein
MTQVHVLLEQTNSIQTQLYELFGFGKKKQSSQDTLDFLEEVYTCVDLLLSETLNYLGTFTDKKQYDKVNLFKKYGVNRIVSLIKEYKPKNIDKNILTLVQEVVLKPLTQVEEKTKVVEIEKQLLNMKKVLLNKMGVKTHGDKVDFDSQVDEPNMPQDKLAADAIYQRQYGRNKNLTEAWKRLEETLE